MNRLMIALTVLLVASIGAASLLAQQLFKQRAEFEVQRALLVGAVEAAQAQRRRSEATLASLVAKNAATARESASAAASLAAAVASAPTWASQPIPIEVQRALDAPSPEPATGSVLDSAPADDPGTAADALAGGLPGAEEPSADEQGPR